MATPKIPVSWARQLAKLHDLVIELQDEFDTYKQGAYCNELNWEAKDFNIDDLTEELEYICDKLSDLEADTSELDCEYNDYGY